MGIFDGVLLCSDWDGSLTAPEAPREEIVCRENRAAIAYFQENGGLFTVASGRYPDYILSFSDQIVPNTAFISLTGAKIVDVQSGSALRESKTDGDVYLLIDEILSGFPYEATFLHYPVNDPHAKYYSREEYAAARKTLEDLPAYKVLLVTDTPEHGVALRDLGRKVARGSDYDAARSWPIGLEFIRREGNKGNAVLWLKRKTEADLLVTVGDFENDIPMLKSADLSFAVANAEEEVKRAATRVTTRTSGAGAGAEIIRIIEKIRKNRSGTTLP